MNEAHRIAAALERLRPMRERGCEVIVVDGGSADGTAELAAPLADRMLSAERGRASQMNAGANAAHGEVLLFLHADCELPADFDRLIFDGLRNSGRCWGRFDVRLIGRHPLLSLISFMMNWRSRITGVATGDQGIFVLRERFLALGGYPAIALMEDIALSRLLKRCGPPLCVSARINASARRWERHGVIRTVLLMWRLRLGYFFGAHPEKLALRYYGVRDD